ncbi:hypothetical protein [Streptomyces sp. NPDC001665]
MTTTPVLLPVPARYALVGDGEHSEVYRRPGARRCVQLFRPDTELTVHRITTEYAYLLRAYGAMPGLIPAQRLWAPSPAPHPSRCVIVKAWVDIDTALPLGRVRPSDLRESTTTQLAQFIEISRSLVERSSAEKTLLPDIIDYRFRNLVVDTDGHLRLLDTNQLISTNALRALAPGQKLDITRRPIHGRFLQRLMYLEAAFRGRTRHQLAADPVYSRYLTPANLHRLFEKSIAEGELL